MKFRKGFFKKLFLLALVCLLLPLFTTGCVKKIDKGYEGAKINTLGSGKGDIKAMGTGWHVFNSFKYDIITNPTFVQEYVWTAQKDEGSPTNESISFQSSNSLLFHANVGISFNIRPGVTGALYEKYHKTVEQMVDTNIRNTVRDSFNREASKRDAEDIYGKGKNLFISDITADIAEYWKDYLIINKIYLIGGLTPPPQISASINKKIEATQKAQQRRNEVAEATAAADKVIETARGTAKSKNLATDATTYEITELAKAKAGAIELVNKQLAKSPLYIEFIKANAWDGKLPIYMMGGDSIPMISLK